ncbi:hypothetical protein [Thiocystis violacea]|uniref:hypothetical protein n=1 Tax=Thiocystis violacea TaxID=13725 RepID=UPI00190738AE|nr:hypothetical protein [Thiocystis violacea]MBK1717311.1 hypothetical protein [Thiocystis violacea]
MITMADLSLDQTPPLDLPLRLFLTAPLFAASAGAVLMIDAGAMIATRWSPSALAATHLITLGFLGQVMIGALLQMLPVLGGVPVPAVRRVATSVHLLLALGAALLALGFLGGGAAALASGAAAAGLGLAVFGLVTLMALWRARHAHASPRGFPLVGLALLATVAIGLVLTLAVMRRVTLPRLLDWVQVHVAWGLFGWVGLLILIIGFQVVPLFHVTPAYPRWMTRALVPTLFLALCVITALPLLAPAVGSAMGRATHGVIAVGFSLFALTTLILQARRARAKLDATLLHWWIAMGAVLAAVLAWPLGASDQLMGLWLLIGVGVGLPSGMLLKIVPFLCWLHLQTRQLALGKRRVRLPHLQQLIPNGPARVQVALHGSGLLLASLGFIYPPAAHVGGAVLALAALWLLALLVGATLRYRAAFARLTVADSDQRTA